MELDNSRFSSLIYRIIGKPGLWHHEYIDEMNKVLDENDIANHAGYAYELKLGEQILNKISNTNEAMQAFGALLDKSRFKMIILDNDLNMVYHNHHAKGLRSCLEKAPNSKQLKIHAFKKVSLAIQQNELLFMQGNHDGLCSIDYLDQNQEQLYLRSIHSNNVNNGALLTHYLVLVVDQTNKNNALNPEFIHRYELTDKEQAVLVNLLHGKSIKQIASSSFVSENTVKTHLKSLFRKTDTKSQTDIVRLVLTDESQILDTYFGSRNSLLTISSSPHPSDKFATLNNGLKIAYREYGPKDGHPIIVFHNGYGCRVTIPNDYQEICARQNKRIIIPDRPGFGLTPYINIDINGWNLMLAEFIDLLDIESYDILGNVLGSVLALNFASRADSKLKKVRLSSPVFVNQPSDSDYLNGIFKPVTRLIGTSKQFTLAIYQLWLKSITISLAEHYRKMLNSSLGPMEKVLFEGSNTIDVIIEGFQQGSAKSINGISNEMVQCLSAQETDLSNISAPVELWWGSEDKRISLKGVKNIARQIKDAKINVRYGYSEHLYYALFEDIIS